MTEPKSRNGEGLTEREYDDAADLIEQFQAQCEIAFEDHAVNAKRWVREQMESIRRAADARTSPRSETGRTPDGYAVVMAEGYFVGIWRDRESAEKILGRSPMAKGERIEPMCFLGTNHESTKP